MKKFDNKDLQEVYENNQAFIEANREKLDKLSRDIKQLETFLSQNVFNLNYSMHLNFDGIGVILSFEKGRLLHHQSQDIRPLIEKPVAQRIKCAPYLVSFLEKAIENSQI
jgi:hypothetical protein